MNRNSILRKLNPEFLIWSFAFSFHAVKLVYWFHSLNWASSFPIVNYDFIQYYARILRGLEFLKISGHFWGYDPYQAAGSLSGVYDAGSLPLIYLCYFLKNFVSPKTVLLIFEVAGISLAPLLVVPVARNIGATRIQSCFVFLITVFLFGYFDPLSDGVITVGLNSYFVGSFLSLWVVSLFWVWAQGQTMVQLVIFFLAAWATFLLHPLTIILMGPALGLIVFRTWPRLSRAKIASLLILGGVFIVATLFWLRPYVAFNDWLIHTPYFQAGGFHALLNLSSLFRGNLFEALRLPFLGLLLILFIYKFLWKGMANQDLRLIFSQWFFWLFLVTFFGDLMPGIRDWQVFRVMFPMFLVATMGAGIELSNLWVKNNASRPYVIGFFFFSFFFFFIRPPTHSNKVLQKFYTDLPPSQIRLIDWLKKSGPGLGRTLLETDESGDPNISDVLPHLIPGLSLMGGPTPTHYLATRFSIFSGFYMDENRIMSRQPRAFNRLLRMSDEKLFSENLRLANIDRVIARSPLLLEVLDSFKKCVTLEDSAGPFRIYRVAGFPNWFLKGKGTIQADYDRLFLRGCSQGELVIKYHYLKSLRSSPLVPLRPIILGEDPIPFIAIDNSMGYADIKIENKGL